LYVLTILFNVTIFIVWEVSMTTTLSIRELTRSGDLLAAYDYIDIEDRKSHQYKGVFVPERHAESVKDFLEHELLKDKQRKVEGLMKFSGMATGDIGDTSIQELKGGTGADPQ
jgi:hypothetical protein